MVDSDQPGTSGAAARLPKNPGSQKLTPPSSARAACDHATLIDTSPIAQPHLAQYPALVAIRVMSVPPMIRIHALGHRAGFNFCFATGKSVGYAALDKKRVELSEFPRVCPKSPKPLVFGDGHRTASIGRPRSTGAFRTRRAQRQRETEHCAAAG